MYPSGWPDVVHIDDLELRYSSDVPSILRSLNGATTADSTSGWLSVVAYALDEDSQENLVQAVDQRRISGLALMVLAHKMCERALGVDLNAASALAGSVLGSWFLLASWAAGKGMRIIDMKVHELLAICYSAQCEQCKEPSDLARLNRKIFRTSHPWGR